MDNLPLQLTSFIGREQELAEVRRLLVETRLLTLTGSGGCGKTRLALEAAAGLNGQFRDGIWWVELASTTEPVHLPQMVLSALIPLGVTEQPDRTPLEGLIAHLRPKQLLLLLDNCEHVVAACADLAETLLRTCPALRILATSRESLGIGGERVWLIPSLTTPLPDSQPPFDELAHYEAVRLFEERAAAVKRTFRLTEHNARAVAQICHRLDGIPLAIELAAARTPVLSVKQIASHLDDCLRLLGAGRRTLLPRHRTLRAAIDWSYDLLTPAEQALFRRLSIFAGGCTLEAAEAICADAHESHSGVGDGDVLDLLSRLIDKSLVTVQEQDDKVRYVLLETMRQYGQEKLISSGEEVGLRARHLDWCLRLAEQGNAETFGPNRAAWMARLESEHENLRAALEWSLGSEAEPARAEQGMRLAIALGSFWYMRGHTSEGRGWLDQVLAQTSGSLPVVRAQALARAGFLAWRQNDYAQASALLEEGQILARSLGAEGRSALQMAINCLGSVAYYQDDYDRAAALFEEWLDLLREMGDREHLPYALSRLGRVAARRGEYARARALAEESLILSRIKICGMGPVQVYRAGSLLAAAAWSYARPKELLFYLLSHPPRTREQIGLAFWPDASPAQLRTRFHDALHHLRRALGNPQWVVFKDGRYTFNRSLTYWYDVELFESRLKGILSDALDGGDPAMVQQLEETLLLYRGDFLEEMEPRDWVLLRREELRGCYLRGLLLLGRWRFAAGHYEAAAEAYRQALLHDAYSEAAHRGLMRCLVRLGAANQALRHYQTLVELLRDEIDTDPAHETIALFESIRRGEVV